MVKIKPHYLGHRQRLRNKFRSTGKKGLNDYELFELLLTYAIPRKDVKAIAKQLLKRHRTLMNVFDQDYEKLETIDGIGEAASTLIHLVKECMIAYLEPEADTAPVINTPEKILDYLKAEIGNLKRECFMLVCLDASLHFIHKDILTIGTTNQAYVYPREVIRVALSKNASGLILIHNHPSGTLKPSDEDTQLTNMITDIASKMGITVHDHIIVTSKGAFSMKEGKCLT